MQFNPEFILSERTLSLANEDQGLSFPLPNHVVVRSGSSRYAFPLKQLVGAQRQAVTKVPLSRPGWAGITYYLGQVWPLHWLGPDCPSEISQPFILFLRNRRLGLAVEEPLTLISCESRDGDKKPISPSLNWLVVNHRLDDATQILEVL